MAHEPQKPLAPAATPPAQAKPIPAQQPAVPAAPEASPEQASTPTNTAAPTQPESTPQAAITATAADQPNPTPASQPAADAAAENLQRLAVEALTSAPSQSSAADAVADAVFTLTGNTLAVETQLSKMMLPMVINQEAEKILRAAILSHAPGLRITLLPTTNPTGSTTPATKKPRAARTGSVQAKAAEHPIVLEAQRLFNAEIRNVIDLSE